MYTAIMLSLYVLSVLFGLSISSNELDCLTPLQKRNLGNIAVEKLTANVQEFIRRNRDAHVSNQNEDNWCCKINPVKTVASTTSQLYYTKSSHDRKSYTSCGFLWLSRCARHHTSYSTSPQYKVTYTYREIPTTCPDDQLVCCNGYTEIAKHCLPNDKLKDIHKDLITLAGQGVFG